MVSQQHRYCSFICKVIDREVSATQRVCEAVGTDSPLAAELWAQAVAVSDSWSRFVELDREVLRQARSVGFTAEQWAAVKDGRLADAPA